ncbi:MAG: hypothetical protein ABT20_12175 [Rubrivivax sp. SCN 70-15]|nr:MAG: hypothetical protein ABT20_12175 [Rubrivivax sp. SCN 70-15]
MGLFSLEHSRAAYRADFLAYGAAVLLLATYLGVDGHAGQRLAMLGWVAAGTAGWTLIEYALHRFVLHGLDPFRRWHAEHHARPSALICTPTLYSAALLFGLVYLPARLLLGPWCGGALTLGVLAGYLAYTVTHHATHHWRGESRWLLQRKRWHALHHRPGAHPGHYGVTTGFWDRAFGSAQTARERTGTRGE